MRQGTLSAVVVAATLAALPGCSATYVTPGGPANLADINHPDIRELADRKPSPNFPARLALARLQRPAINHKLRRASAADPSRW